MRRVSLVVLMLCALPVSAQESRAMLLGVVTDATGAVTPGAALTATNTETEVRYSAETNAEGNYVIPYLPPGAYRLRAEQPGFRAFERGPVALRTGDRVRIDVVLEVGRVAENVTVVGDTPPLESTNASLGLVIDMRRVAELPIAHGNVYHLTQLVPGVAFTGNATLDRPFDPSHIANYAMGGGYALRNEITLDGAPNSSSTAGRNQTAAAYVPPADIIGEMRITTLALDASAGHTEGGVMNISLRSGSNTPHLTVYDHLQAPRFMANSWLGNKRGQPRPDFVYNRWGASFAGPIQRNRTFFLWGYEGIRERRPRTQGDQTVPTQAERQGDFSALLSLDAHYQLYDPATRRRNPAGGALSDPLPGNVIPHARISPIAANILRYFALPNASGTADGENNFATDDMGERIAYMNHAWRVDHNPGDRNRIFASAALYNRTSDYQNYFRNASTGEIFQFMARRAALDGVHVLSPSSVLNLRYAYNRFIRAADLNPESHGFDLTTLAPGNAAWQRWNNSTDERIRRFPLIDIAGYFNLVGTSASGVLYRPQDTHSFTAALDRAQGSHLLKLGGEYRVYRKNESNPYPGTANGATAGSATGWIRFAEDWTSGPTDTSPAPRIGAGLASFLLGLPTGGGVLRRDSFAEQSSVSALYFQDDWKLSRSLTLTLGLRYELEGPLTERFDRSVRGFDPAAVLPIDAQVQANYAAIAPLLPERPMLAIRGGVTFANRGGEPRNLYGHDANNLMPRLGLAWRVDSKTVARAGYGVFFGSMGVRRGDVYQTGFSYTTPLIASEDNGLSFVATLANPFPNGALPPPGASLGAMAGVGDPISYFNTRYVAPRVERWQVSVQREMPAAVTLELAYVGNRGSSLETSRNPNGIPLGLLSRSSVRDQARIDYLGRQDLANPFFGAASAASTLGGSRTVNRAGLLTAYPQFTRIDTTTNEGASWYHSLQARAERRFSAGHTATAAYTWSKLMDATTFLNDMDPAPYRGISAADYPHRFSASWICELPFGPDRKFGSRVPRLAGHAIGGWQVEGIYVRQSGVPLGFGNIIFNGSIKDIPLQRPTAERWFNTDAGFVTDSRLALAYNVRTFPMRFSGVRGPGMNNWDLSVLKNTRLGEKASLQLRGEFLNAMNRVWFGTPNTNPTSTAFGAITSEQGYMRRVQLGARLIY